MMKKPILIAPRSQAREMDRDSPDAKRLLESGSYVVVQVPPKRKKGAALDRQHKLRKRAAGYKELFVWLPPGLLERFNSAKRSGETSAMLLERLLGLADENT